MKTQLLTAGVVTCLSFLMYAFVGNHSGDTPLAIGDDAPKTEWKMQDVSGTEISLDEVAKESGLLVIFSCNTCPFVIGNGTKSEGWDGRYPEIYDMANGAEIGMVLVNSNEAKRTSGDGMSDMKRRYADEGYKGYYALDKDHVLADAFGAMVTPHVFLFDKNMKLVYKGAIDDSVNDSQEVKEPYLKNAIKSVTNGEKPEPESTRHLGCSIKRVKV